MGKQKKMLVWLKENICVFPNHFVIVMANITSLLVTSLSYSGIIFVVDVFKFCKWSFGKRECCMFLIMLVVDNL